MAISEKLKHDVAEQNAVHVINDLISLIYEDRGFYTNAFSEAWDYVKQAHIPDLENVAYDGEAFKLDSDWTKEYWAEQIAALRFNFCQERIDHLKAVGRKLYPHVQQHNPARHRSTMGQGGATQERPKKVVPQLQSKWMIAGAVAIVIIAGVAYLMRNN